MKNPESIHDLALDMLSRLASEGKEVLQGVRMLSHLTNDDGVPDIEHMAAMQALEIIQNVNHDHAVEATPEIIAWIQAEPPTQAEEDLLDMALSSLEMLEIFDSTSKKKKS